MGTNWNIQCRECGRRVFDAWERRHPATLAELCASGALIPMHNATLDRAGYKHGLIHDIVPSENIDLSTLPRECACDFEPINEYGDWARSEHWPPWHEKSRTVASSIGFAGTETGGATCRAG